LSWRQVFDPETQVEHFTTYDRSGSVKLTWIVAGGQLVSFWEPPDSPPQFGEGFAADTRNGTMKNYECHSHGDCDVSSVHYEYLDAEKRNPRSAEWRDSEGNLRFAAYFDYEIDSFRNWTYRKVWVWTRDLVNAPCAKQIFVQSHIGRNEQKVDSMRACRKETFSNEESVIYEPHDPFK
jgi:hypothetical protein